MLIGHIYIIFCHGIVDGLYFPDGFVVSFFIDEVFAFEVELSELWGLQGKEQFLVVAEFVGAAFLLFGHCLFPDIVEFFLYIAFFMEVIAQEKACHVFCVIVAAHGELGSQCVGDAA